MAFNKPIQQPSSPSLANQTLGSQLAKFLVGNASWHFRSTNLPFAFMDPAPSTKSSSGRLSGEMTVDDEFADAPAPMLMCRNKRVTDELPGMLAVRYRYTLVRIRCAKQKQKKRPGLKVQVGWDQDRASINTVHPDYWVNAGTGTVQYRYVNNKGGNNKVREREDMRHHKRGTNNHRSQ